jgi:hypothetical protein
VIAKTFENSAITVDAGTGLDPRINYPSYKSFDRFIDVERLRSLDAYIARQIRRHVATATPDYFVNEHRLDADSPYKPGVREIWLSRTLPGVPYNYLDLDRTELWARTPECESFTLLMEFIDTLPFESTGRILIIYDDSGSAVPAHRDHENTEICNDFIWFRTNLRKPFYMLDKFASEKLYVGSYSAWFDAVNQFHGSDAGNGLTFSIRVDGHFTDEFRRMIPRPERNAASTPSLWASLERDV